MSFIQIHRVPGLAGRHTVGARALLSPVGHLFSSQHPRSSFNVPHLFLLLLLLLTLIRFSYSSS